MANKNLKFYVHQVIIKGLSPFNCATFDVIKSFDTETQEMKKVKDGKNEILSVSKIAKIVYEDRFIALSFDEGDKYPYPPKVVNDSLCEEDNPRAPSLIELDEQLFVLIDIGTQRIWISNQQKRGDIRIWLEKKLHKDVCIKSIINNGEFIDKIKSVKEISFSVAPNLFNSPGQDTLSSHLVGDIYGFGAKKARLSLEYENSKISDKIKAKLSNLFGKQNEFEDITVIGRSDEDFESTFNMNEITSKLQIDLPVDEKSKLLDAATVFASLIKKIK
jgi:hypothetical protein